MISQTNKCTILTQSAQNDGKTLTEAAAGPINLCSHKDTIDVIPILNYKRCNILAQKENKQ